MYDEHTGTCSFEEFVMNGLKEQLTCNNIKHAVL